MSQVTTIFGEVINANESSQLMDGRIFSRYNYVYVADSNEQKKIVACSNWNGLDWETTYVLKTDALRIHRSPNGGGDYISKASLTASNSPVVQIEYNGKTYTFRSEVQRFNAGFVWSMDEFRWIDLKVADRNMWGDLRLVRTNESDWKYVYSRNGSYNSPSYVDANDYIRMAQVSSFSLPIYYQNTHRSLVVDAYSDRLIHIDSATEFHTMLDGVLVNFYMESRRLWRFNEGEIVPLQVTAELVNINREFRNTMHNGKRYFDRESAVANGYTQVFCSHCRRDVDASHDMVDCASRNFRNERFGYHSSQQVKTINMPMNVVFKIGVEIEKQSRLGAVNGANEIYHEFGWKKERDGSLDDTIGYELVSPCYPLFTDDLINEAKAIETRFPNLIDSNEDKANLGRFKEACGGHIHFSRSYTSGQDTFEMISGYMPLFYAIYKKRINITYCEAKEKYRMKSSVNTKYQAVKIMDKRIEFRIFPLVENIKTLEWRIGLLRIMANNPTDSFIEVANMLCDSSSDLHKHMLKIFTLDKLKRRMLDSIDMALDFDRDCATYDFTNLRSAIRSL
jgi:hypothetical protein